MSVNAPGNLFSQPFAQGGDKTIIPADSAAKGRASLAGGFPMETQMREEAGGIPPNRLDFNGILYMMSSFLWWMQSGGQWEWRADLDYAAPALVFRAGKTYNVVRESGPGTGSGPQDPALDSAGEYWKLTLAGLSPDGQSIVINSEGNLTAKLSQPYRICEFKSWFEQTPPSGWAVRNGATIANARDNYPQAWEHLTDPANAWKTKTPAEWTALSQTSPWNGIGGVPYFVADAATGSLKLPDTRGMYMEDAGFDGLTVGGVHGDAIRNVIGQFSGGANGSWTGPFFTKGETTVIMGNEGNLGVTCWRGYFDASNAVPTANVNRPRAFGALPCVYLGTPAV